ncbi:hypothetical protein NSQ62_07875 [Solibacillus sp. FSL H8-0523]|uniref:hypothetical protein n=1 Tax=Solibacillus sp. FSL H8-0523 TaxID=2954511 RepID=UPI003101527E
MSLSIAGALVELKLLDKRIEKATNNALFVSIKQGKDVPKLFKNIDEVNATIKASQQSVTDLIKRRNVIKSAIVVSNATTGVTIAGETMTVAEAIERKNSIEYDKALLFSYQRQLAASIKLVDKHNLDVMQRADMMVQTFLGNDKSKASEAESLRSNFLESHSASLVDPIDIKKIINNLELYIDNFEAEVDLVLSTSNAITYLEID